MSKPFDYSKWDKIELSDDEDDVHPNIDRESWFRMKHRSRVEREENEDKDKTAILDQITKDTKRIAVLEHDLKKIMSRKKEDNSDEEDDDEDLDDTVGIKTEIEELKTKNKIRKQRLDEYEKNKKWNVDNMCEVKEERTVVNPSAAKTTYTETGYVVPKDDFKKMDLTPKASDDIAVGDDDLETFKNFPDAPAAAVYGPPAAKESATTTPKEAKTKTEKATASVPTPKPKGPAVDVGSMETYHEFTEKYSDVVEQFMAISDLNGSKVFLLRNADIILQENASNYLLLASLEDEMNGYHKKMKQTARQSQIVTSIAELAKTLKTHPGNVIEPFFSRLEQREHLEEFIKGCKDFEQKIEKRAVVKKEEMDAARGEDLDEIPREKRLGPGGLDPMEVIETLPEEMVTAFESRDVEKLKEVLMKMEPEEAEYHMKRCVDSGLWVQ